VQESAAASASLEEQAGRLSQAVAVFKISQHQAKSLTAPAVNVQKPLKLTAARQITASDEGSWETF